MRGGGSKWWTDISDLNIFTDTFVDSQIAAGLSPATINRRLASLQTFFEYLASEKLERDWPHCTAYVSFWKVRWGLFQHSPR